MLHRPVLARSVNRTILAPNNPVCGDPTNWFTHNSFLKRNVRAATFDFFVDWEHSIIRDEVWVKLISDDNDVYKMDKREIAQSIINAESLPYLQSLHQFCRKKGFHLKFMLFSDCSIDNWRQNNGRIIEYDSDNFDVTVRTYNEISEIIGNLRVQPVPIGPNGLVYSTSNLEAALSTSHNIWPGDADSIIFDSNYDALGLFEFKKHTSRSSIPFDSQQLSNYIRRDSRKYESLGLMRDRLQTSLYVIYFPIPEDINIIKLEKTEGPWNDLKTAWIEDIALPDINNAISMDAFANSLLSLL